MWALCRASNPLKVRAFSIRTCQASYANLQVASYYMGDKTGTGDSHMLEPDGCGASLKRFHSATHGYPKFSVGSCSFSSQADSKSSANEEDDLEDEFSELESPTIANASSDIDEESKNELISEPELSEEEEEEEEGGGGDVMEEPQDYIELSDAEGLVTQKNTPRLRASSALYKAVFNAPVLSVKSALDKWVEEGYELTRTEVSMAMVNLRKRRMYGRALQLSEWLDSTKQIDFVEQDYASRLDLIAKVYGLQKANNYIEKIPKSFKGEKVYRTLLANCVAANNGKKAEAVFNKMKDLEFPLSSFACNQLLLLYKRLDKKKIADVLLLMEKENVKPTLFTYGILIDTKGQSNDISGMDQVVETMKAEGIEPDLRVQAILARHYVCGGLKEKAESVLKEMEGDDLKDNRWACHALLPLYASLGKADEVARIWKICGSKPTLSESMAAIEAWGKLGKIEEAEAVFERMLETWKKLYSKHYSALLKVYVNHKMLTKGKDLVKRMGESGCKIGPLTWDALIKLYIEAGELEKADSIIQKASQKNQVKPMFCSYMAIMDQYAKSGDVHNSEKMFYNMRQSGYYGRIRQFESLIQAYINAKVPAYGMRERMKADNIFPNKVVAGMLSKVDAFRKTAVSELLD